MISTPLALIVTIRNTNTSRVLIVVTVVRGTIA
jgi:hypothetical protein